MSGNTESPAAFPWGILGSGHEARDLTDGALGVVRTVSIGLSYRKPPLPAGHPAWRPSPLSATQFEMSWSGNLSQVQSLSQLGEELASQAGAKGWKNIPCDAQVPAELQRLDQVVKRLLEVVEHLHQRNHGVGLLTPQGVLVTEGATPSVVLPDVGFTWDCDGMPVVPDFLDPGGPYAPLWELGPATQLARGGAAEGGAFDPRPDVQVLGRVLASILLRRIVGSIPAPDDCPETTSQADDIPGGRRVWETLQDAVAGRIDSVDGPEGLAARLDATPLSQHYLGVKRPPPRSWQQTAKVAAKPAALLVLVVMLVLAGVYGPGVVQPWRFRQAVAACEVAQPETKRNALNRVIELAATPAQLETAGQCFDRYLDQWQAHLAAAREEWTRNLGEPSRLRLKHLRDELNSTEVETLSRERQEKREHYLMQVGELLAGTGFTTAVADFKEALRDKDYEKLAVMLTRVTKLANDSEQQETAAKCFGYYLERWRTRVKAAGNNWADPRDAFSFSRELQVLRDELRSLNVNKLGNSQKEEQERCLRYVAILMETP